MRPDRDLQIRQIRHALPARKDPPALLRIVPGALDLAPIRPGDGIVDEQERGARVGNGGAGVGVLQGGGVADGEGGGGKGPEAAGGVDGGVEERGAVLGGVDEAEFVGARRGVFEVGGEERGGEVVADGVEEGFLPGGLDGVEGAEGQADEAVGGGVGGEGGADAGGEFDRLRGGGRAADVHGVGADEAGGAGAVAVLDVPG